VFLLWILTDPKVTSGGLELGWKTPGSLPGLFAALALATSYTLITPIVEELAFRGFLARRLTSVDFDRLPPRDIGTIAILVSSLLFGLLHERWLAAALAGVVFALVYRRSGRLADAILAHATTNGLLAAAAFMTGSPDLLG
jgi:CAAX prenyl protease-like protein